MKNNSNFNDFVNNFDIVENAIDMRTLLRWNGRDLRNKENLAEHTHLVVACAIKLYDKIHKYLGFDFGFERVIRLSMLHDSLEMLRGDILSITKDTIPGLRDCVDNEEHIFYDAVIGVPTQGDEITERIVRLADLMACYKFIENELRFPSNDYMTDVYKTTKKKFDDEYMKFCIDYGINEDFSEQQVENKFVKGYQADAGTDIILTEDIEFMPMSTTSFGLKVQIIPKEGQMSLLCARTSAANKGLVVAMCPIDPNFCGEVTAIVHNVSNHIIKYKKGESFCQYVTVPIQDIEGITPYIKKEGKRSDGKLGSTGR